MVKGVKITTQGDKSFKALLVGFEGDEVGANGLAELVQLLYHLVF
jgi:hypothetical protein